MDVVIGEVCQKAWEVHHGNHLGGQPIENNIYTASVVLLDARLCANGKAKITKCNL